MKKSGRFTSYLSPFSFRYGSKEMRSLFSEEYKYTLWRKIWVALATSEYKAGLVSKKELDDLKKHQNNIDIDRILEIEKETKHDVVSAIREYAEKAKIGGGKIHLGATSMDIQDNADMVRIVEALTLVEKKLISLLKEFSVKIAKYADLPCIAFTHLQPAEPTTVGYRLALYAQDLLTDFNYLQFVKQNIVAKGFKGAVGTAASYDSLLKNTNYSVDDLDKELPSEIRSRIALISSQVYPRKSDVLVISLLSSIASSCAKFASDVRILQSPQYGEWSEPFGKSQVGSSAMPFKRNPITSENICSLARYVVQLSPVVCENAMHSYLERTLDDSANKRVVIPEAFLSVDHILISTEKVISGLVVNTEKIASNLSAYAPFAATETLLLTAVKKGGNRQELHERMRTISMRAWKKVQEGKENPLVELIKNDKLITRYVSQDDINTLLDVKKHIGTAPVRARRIVRKIEPYIVQAVQ